MLFDGSLVPTILTDGVIRLAFRHRDANRASARNTHRGCMDKLAKLTGKCPKRRLRVIDVKRDHVNDNIKGFAFECGFKGSPFLAVARDDTHIRVLFKAMRSSSAIVEDNFIPTCNQRLRDCCRYQSRPAK